MTKDRYSVLLVDDSDDDRLFMRRAIRAVHRSPTALESALRRAHAPTRPAEIGIPEPAYREAVLHAREIRDRFTFLDFAAESGGIPSEVAA